MLPVTEQDVMLKKHSEELLELQNKLQHLESIFSNKKGIKFNDSNANFKSVFEHIYAEHFQQKIV